MPIQSDYRLHKPQDNRLYFQLKFLREDTLIIPEIQLKMKLYF